MCLSQSSDFKIVIGIVYVKALNCFVNASNGDWHNFIITCQKMI